MQTLVPMERVEWGWGLELVALVVNSIFVGVLVPQMWAFSPHTTMLAGLLRNCWEGSVVDHLPAIGYFLGCGGGYF